VNCGFFMGVVDIQVALGVVIARYCVMGGYLKCFYQVYKHCQKCLIDVELSFEDNYI